MSLKSLSEFFGTASAMSNIIRLSSGLVAWEADTDTDDNEVFCKRYRIKKTW